MILVNHSLKYHYCLHHPPFSLFMLQNTILHYASIIDHFHDRDQIFLFPTSFTNTSLFHIFHNSESFGKEGRKDDSILNTGRKEKRIVR